MSCSYSLNEARVDVRCVTRTVRYCPILYGAVAHKLNAMESKSLRFERLQRRRFDKLHHSAGNNIIHEDQYDAVSVVNWLNGECLQEGILFLLK